MSNKLQLHPYWPRKAKPKMTSQHSQAQMKTKNLTPHRYMPKRERIPMTKMITWARRRVSELSLKRCARQLESSTQRQTGSREHSSAWLMDVIVHLPKVATWRYIWGSTPVTNHTLAHTAPRHSHRVASLVAISRMCTRRKRKGSQLEWPRTLISMRAPKKWQIALRKLTSLLQMSLNRLCSFDEHL